MNSNLIFPIQESDCRKKRYQKRREANKQRLALVKSERGLKRSDINVYFCQPCQSWHVGGTHGLSREKHQELARMKTQ